MRTTSRRARGEWPVNTFIQELGENGVDFAHLKFLHHAPIIPTGECRADGIHWHVNMANGYIIIEQTGPGLQVVRFTKGSGGDHHGQLPDPGQQLAHHHAHGLHAPEVPATARRRRQLAADMLQEQVGQGSGAEAGFESVDMIVWNNKRYREQPLLCDGDGEILKWRKYFSQFYVK